MAAVCSDAGKVPEKRESLKTENTVKEARGQTVEAA